MGVKKLAIPEALRTPENARALKAGYAAVFFLLFTAWLKLFYAAIPQGQAVAESWYEFSARLAVQSGAANLGIVLALAAPLLLLRPPYRLAAVWLFNLAITVVVVSDVLNLRFFGDILSVASGGDVEQVGLVLDSVAALLHPVDSLLLLDLAVALFAAPWYLRRAGEDGAPLRRAVATRAAVLGVAIVLLVPVPIVALDLEGTFTYNYFRFIGARKIGVVNYHLYEGGRHAYRDWIAGHEVSDADRERAATFFREWRAEATAPSKLFGVARGKNAIFLMVESLQGFPVGLRVAGREVTPNLNRLARESMYFENFYRQAWDGRTSDGEFISLQSLHPLPAGAASTTYGDHGYRGVPEVLAERGYSTMAAHAYYGTLWNKRAMGERLGFQRSYFRESFRGKENVGLGLGDADFLPQTIPMLKRERAPFMAYLLTLSSHHPYEMPDELKTLPVPGLEGTLLSDYLQTVHYADAALGDFVRRLAAEGILDETVLVVYGDHDAQLGPPADLEKLLTRYAGFAPRAPGFDARYWREENRLPLIIRLPGGAAAGTRTASAGQVDIAPTVLNLLGIANHTLATLGRDLTHERDALVALRNGSFVLGDTVCVTPSAWSATTRCANLRSGGAVDASRFTGRFAEVREQLAISDLVLMGDLIPDGQKGAPAAR